MGSLFPVPSLDRTGRPGQAGISFTPAEGNISAWLVEASPPGIAALGLEGDSAPSQAHHKPTGGGIPPASAQVFIKKAPTWELLVPALMDINSDGGQE